MAKGKGKKILGLGIPTLAVGAVAIWYFFLRKKGIGGTTTVLRKTNQTTSQEQMTGIPLW